MIYLDNAATTFPKPEKVFSEMDRVNRTLSVNAGRGSYRAAREAADIIFDLRKKIIKLMHAEEIADVVLASSVTQAFNQVLGGFNFQKEDIVYISPYEHNAVARTLHILQEKMQFQIELLPLKKNLEIDLQKIEYMFSNRKPDYVIMNMVSNVTGYVLPVNKVFDIAKHYGSITIVDGAQATGICQMDMEEMQADIICFAGHKTLQGPFGIGGFVIRKEIPLNIVLVGGTGSDSLNLDMPESRPGKYEASSPNIIAAAGLSAALDELDVEEHRKKVTVLTEYLLEKLKNLEHIHILGRPEGTIPMGIVSFVVDGLDSDDVGTILDEEFDIAVRTGYHCAPYIHDYLNDKKYNGTVRIGIGFFNTREEVDKLIEALESL